MPFFGLVSHFFYVPCTRGYLLIGVPNCRVSFEGQTKGLSGPGICHTAFIFFSEKLIHWEGLIRKVLRHLDVLLPGHSCVRNKVLGPFVQVLIGRFLHLWNRDEADSVCKVG